MDCLIEMKGITKKFGSFTANDGIDFDLRAGETHAIVGENGAGKTTLMRMLYGQYQADQGSIFVDGKESRYDITGALALGIAMVHQNFMQIEGMSIAENIILGHAPKKGMFIDYAGAKKEIGMLLERMKILRSPDTKIRDLCVGERQKTEIVKALYLGARILILDEPTAVLTPQETEELFHIIRDLNREGKSIIFISHKLREVKEISDRITVIRHGKVSAHFSSDKVSETDIARAMVGKQNIVLLQNEKRGAEEEICFSGENLWCFDSLGTPKLRNLSLKVRKGEILGIVGVAGNGQEELIELILGLRRLSGGSFWLGKDDITKRSNVERRKLGIGYIPEDRMTVGLSVDSTISENLICGDENAFRKNIFLDAGKIEARAEQLIEEYDIRGGSTGKKAGQLSGGNMQKIILAREICQNPRLLIAAQPTRGLDIGAINFVRKILLEEKEKGTSVILVSADLEELCSLSDRIMILYDGRSMGEIDSDEIQTISDGEIGLMMGGVSRMGECK